MYIRFCRKTKWFCSVANVPPQIPLFSDLAGRFVPGRGQNRAPKALSADGWVGKSDPSKVQGYARLNMRQNQIKMIILNNLGNTVWKAKQADLSNSWTQAAESVGTCFRNLIFF